MHLYQWDINEKRNGRSKIWPFLMLKCNCWEIGACWMLKRSNVNFHSLYLMLVKSIQHLINKFSMNQNKTLSSFIRGCTRWVCERLSPPAVRNSQVVFSIKVVVGSQGYWLWYHLKGFSSGTCITNAIWLYTIKMSFEPCNLANIGSI